jgi:S-layer protein
MTRAQAALNIMAGAEANNTPQGQIDAARLAKVITVATDFTHHMDTTAEVIAYAGSAAAATARAMLLTVTNATDTTAFLTTVDSTIATITAGGGAQGTTFTLTTGTDNFTGTAANDSFSANRSVGSNNGLLETLGNSDVIDGGAGTDSLTAQFVTANVNVTPTIRNIETLNLEAQANATLNMINSDASVKTVSTANNAGTLTVTNLQGKVDNFNVTNTANNVTVSMNAGLAGATDAATLTLSNVTNGAVMSFGNNAVTGGNGYETMNIVSNGTVANNITLDDTPIANAAGSLATIKVSGANNLTLGSANGMTTVTTVDASTFTGALTYTAAANNGQAMTVTGGTGDDIININGYTTADTVNGGAGTDRLVLTSAEIAAATTAQTKVTNVEVIGVNGAAGGSYAVNNFGATGLRLDGTAMAGALTVGYAAGTNSLDLQTSASGGAVIVNVAGVATNDVLNVTMGSTTAGNTFGANALTINGAETVNLLSQGGANTFGAGFTITDTAANQALVITGNQNITFTGAVRADSIDASGMTGTATLTLTAGTGTTATTITGTANGDIINGSTAGDIINGGAGDDTIANVVTGTPASAADVISGGAGNDTIILRGDTASGIVSTIAAATSFVTDFTVGATATTTDILQLSATSANYANAVTGGSALFAGIAAAAAGATSIQNVAQNAAATAIVTGTDMLKLTTGVATAGITLQAAFNAAIGTATVTGLSAKDAIFATIYDTTNGRMDILTVNATNGTNTVVETGDVVSLVGTVTMSAADYASFNANNLSIIAA